MKRMLRLSACTAAALAGALAPASVAQADTATTTPTADYVCESFTRAHNPVSRVMYGENCTGPTDILWLGDPPRIVTDGTYFWKCPRMAGRLAEFGPARGYDCHYI